MLRSVGAGMERYGAESYVKLRWVRASQGRFDPVRVARIGVAGKAGFVDFGLGAVR